MRAHAGILCLFTLLSATAMAQSYYVDYAGGNDAADGKTTATAWKRAPGDPKAGGVAASTTLVAGDSVLLKGGVVYEGDITIRNSGVAGRPITFKGDGWGTGKALIEGSAPYAPAWTRCATAAECLGNPNFAQIYYAPAPAGFTDFRTALYENGGFMWYAQGPNPGDPFYHDDIDDFYVVPDNSTTIKQTTTTVTDPRVFTQSSATYWNNAYVAVWVNGNVVDVKRITGYNPATATVTHQQLGNTPYTDRDGRYCLMNHLSLIDRPGEYVYDPASNRIYLWPRNGQNPSGNKYGVYSRDIAFYAGGAVSHLVIEGFRIERFSMGVKIENGAGTNIVVRNNDLHTLRAGDWYAIHVATSASLIEGNSVVDANRAVGILCGNDNMTVRNNYVARCSRQGIWYMGATNGRIEGNTVTDIKGSHANGISIYMDSSNIVVNGNRVTEVNSPVTFEQSQNLTFTNNVIVGTSAYTNINDWGGCTGTITFHNNTCPNSTMGLFSSGATYVMRNNVLMSAPSGITRSHNIFTRSGITLQTGEFIETDLTKLFTAAGSGDYSLKTGSRAIDVGTTLPMTKDIVGTTRPQGAAFDIGAYEFVSGTSSPPVITSHPANKSVTAGQTATFSITATGTAPLTYQWQKNGADIGGATAASYTTPATVGGDNGAMFRVIVRNSAGSATSNSATLTVTTPPPPPSPPVITSHPANKTVTAGQTATFSVTATGTAPLTYQWQKNGADIGGATAATYTTPATASGDNGAMFRVIVRNSAGSATSNSATLTVTSPPPPPPTNRPPALISPATATPNPALTGESILFSAAAFDADGDTLTYVWTFGDETSALISPASHTYAAAGTYTATVTISDGHGGTVSDSTTVTINARPDEQIVDLGVVFVGDRLRIDLAAAAGISGRLTWTASTPLPPGMRLRYGKLVGTAKSAGDFVFEMRVTSRQRTLVNGKRVVSTTQQTVKFKLTVVTR